MILTSRSLLVVSQGRLDQCFPRKVQARKTTFQCVHLAAALFNGKPGFVQLCRLALRGHDDHARINPGRHRFCKGCFHIGGASGKRIVDDGIECEPRRVGNNRCHIIERDLTLAVSIKRELAESRFAKLAGRHQAARSEPRERQARFSSSRCAAPRRSGAPDRARYLHNTRWRPPISRVRTFCGAVRRAAARPPRSRRGNP